MVYLIHFDKPYEHAKHYIGFAESATSFKQRIACHRKGAGANLLSVILKAGIDFSVVRIWPDADRNYERALKNGKATPRLCPVCNPRAVKTKEGDASYVSIKGE